ncbi:MAG TPA: YitT family protein [Caldithrix abyssi]|uniref:YitT family protein n=1 Tax=Caldithrix abyssi TaxID=187145 RepID=A0A7V5RQF7_CALAY|nr:YitT family protein [Caldithrix abyssi]
MQKILSHKTIRDYVAIFIGAMLMGISISVFLIDARVVPGGISAVAMAIHYLSDGAIPVGLSLWLMNIPLFLWGMRELGGTFAARTVFGFSVSAFSIDLFRGDIPGLDFIKWNSSAPILDLLHHDFFFLTVIGAALLGVGMGLVLRHRGTIGGADVITAILHKRYGIKPGQSIIFLNVIIISLATVVIELKDLSPERPALSLAFYAFLLTFILSRIVDMLLDGFDYARSAWIISEKCGEIGRAILHDMNRGATAFKGRGLYLNTDRDILMTVITRRELPGLQERIQQIDPEAFVIISTVHEVLGEGFKRRT